MAYYTKKKTRRTYDDLVVFLKLDRSGQDRFGNQTVRLEEDGINRAFCKLSSISRQEFYLADHTDYKPAFTVSLLKNQYQGEEYFFVGKSLDLKENLKAFLEGGSILYQVYRTYEPDDFEIELTAEEVLGTRLEEIKEAIEEAADDPDKTR